MTDAGRARLSGGAASGSRHGRQLWVGAESRAGGGSPRHSDTDIGGRLSDHAFFHRAVDAYLALRPMVARFRLWRATADAEPRARNQIVTWGNRLHTPMRLEDAGPEAVYALAALDLERDGAMVVEVPPSMLGGIGDLRQGTLLEIGLAGADKGRGGRVLVLPPGHKGASPEGYVTVQARTHAAILHVRGFLVNGRPDVAATSLQATRIHPLEHHGPSPETIFVRASEQDFEAFSADPDDFFGDLAHVIEREASDALSVHERERVAALGIDKSRAFRPDARRRSVLAEAARFGAAIVRVDGLAPDDPARLAYPDRRWQWLFVGDSGTWDPQGQMSEDRCAAFWTPRDAAGAFLDGSRRYRLHLPANIPVQTSWSVGVDHPERRSAIGTVTSTLAGPSTRPDANADGSVDIFFGPRVPRDASRNWIRTIEGRGWFPVLRFFGPLTPFFDRTWKAGDIEATS